MTQRKLKLLQKLKHVLLSFFKRFLKTELLENTGSSVFVKEDEKIMWLFVGLGNHGDKYAKNRHNIGFMAVDAIQSHFSNFTPFKQKFQGQISEGKIAGQKVILLKPETYMNNSGQAVIKAAQFYKIPADHVIAFHDELDILPAQLRIKKGGGNAGHNGLKSIQAHLSTPDFWRIRMGIGRPPHQGDVSNYVLGDFSKAEMQWVMPFVDYLAKHVELIVNDDFKGYEKSVQELMKKEKGTENGI